MPFPETPQAKACRLAIGMGDAEQLRRLLDEGADPNATTDMGHSLVCEAVSCRKPDLVRLLVERGAGFHQPASSPLVLALLGKQFDTAQLLLDLGHDVNHGAGSAQHSILNLFAVMEPAWELVQWLLDHGADPNLQNEKGETPLLLCAKRGWSESARKLIEHGADVNRPGVRQVWGKPVQEMPLKIAQDYGQTAVAELLRQHGARDNAS